MAGSSQRSKQKHIALTTAFMPGRFWDRKSKPSLSLQNLRLSLFSVVTSAVVRIPNRDISRAYLASLLWVKYVDVIPGLAVV